MITFTFDDGYVSTLEVARPILQQFGMVATVGVVCNELLWERTWGSMGLDELRILADQGWEVASHSLFHCHLPCLPLSYADERTNWQYDPALEAFFAEYPLQEASTVICDGRFLTCMPSIEDFRRSGESFFHHLESKRIYARTEAYRNDSPPLLVGSAEREIAESRRVLEKHGFAVNSFIVPYSAWPQHLHNLGTRYYPNVAWVTNRLNIGPSPNLFRFSITKDKSADDVAAQVTHHLEHDSWCILCFHEIVAEADWQFDWPVSEFRRLVEWIDANRIPVHTLSNGAELRARGQLQEDSSTSTAASPAVTSPMKTGKPAQMAAAVDTVNTIKDMERRLREQKDYSAGLYAKFKAEEARRVETAQRLHANWTAKKRFEEKIGAYGTLIDILAFAHACEARAETWQADAYIVHDMFPLCAGYSLARRRGGLLFCDVVDGALVADRPWHGRWPEEMLTMFDAASEMLLTKCDGLLTVSDTYAEMLRKYGPPVHMIPNYRPAETIEASLRLRELCGIGANDSLLLTIGHIVAEFENVLHGVQLLGKNFHLAALSGILPESYRNSIVSLISQLGLGDRVHLLDPVPYEELASTASGADVGLIVLSPDLASHWRTLPNRVFDFIAAGVPFCTPQLPEIARIAENYGVGVVVGELSPLGWAEAIRDVLARREEMQRNCRFAASQLTWESCEEQFRRLLPDVRRVAFLGVGDLTRHNRTRRLATALANTGISVVVAMRFQGEPAKWHDAIEFCRIDP